MVKHRNIIDFDTSRRSAIPENAVHAPQLVVSAQRTAKHYLNELLPKFFSQIDDSLFKLADRAESNQQQTLYFDAMREIRLQHELMHKIYFSALESGFKLSLSQAVIAPPKSGDLDKAGLVQDEKLEESLAIRNMASAADNTYSQALSDLAARINFIIENTEITKENNPLRPEVLCNAFSVSAGCMNTDIKVRLVVYKLFDKFVIQKLGDMYDAINADLIAAGVLPRIKNEIRRTEGSIDQHISNRSAVSKKTESETDNVFHTLRQMLSRQRADHEEDATTDSFISASQTGEGTPGEPSFSPGDVIAALSKLQLTSDIPLLQNQDQESSNIIKSVVMKEIDRTHGTSGGKHIRQTDLDSIDIVSRLFDFILDDPNLTDYLKVQIVRLQIPLLKVAILDNEFFSVKSHPARQLLNELAYAGSGLDKEDPEENSTLQMVGYVVDRILVEFEENTTIFSALLTEFTEFMESEKESNKLTEEILEEAKNTAVREIQLKMAGHNIPPLINTIFLDAWKDVLTHLYLRDGIKSTAWERALQVADDLIWSVEPKLIVSQRNRLIKVIPGILNGLRDGFTLINFDMKRSEHLFDQLEELHLASLRGGISELMPEQDFRPSRQSSELIHYDASDFLTEDDFGIDLSNFPENPVTSEEDPDSYTYNNLTSSDNDDILFSIHTETVNEMALGTWVEFIDPDTGTHNRGKLAWKCDFTREFTFVDRKYKVVADMTLHQLIEEFEMERAIIIEDIPLFDRALDSVIVGIKQALDIKNISGNTSKY